jgi:hypothetical protein
MSFTGEALSFFMSSIYTITGAVMGSTPGGEFLAAIQAARAQGAEVVLGDRDQNATLARLQYYTRYLTQRDSRRQVHGQADAAVARKLDWLFLIPAWFTACWVESTLHVPVALQSDERKLCYMVHVNRRRALLFNALHLSFTRCRAMSASCGA